MSLLGFIDGIHIKIDRPTRNQESYWNRKNYHSIQTQIICDNQCKIIDVFIGFPGSVHDALVFSSSFIYQSLPNLCEGIYFQKNKLLIIILITTMTTA